jgi:hypothetical protein
VDWDGSFASRAVMTGDAELWRAAIEDARLTAVERQRVDSVLAEDEGLRCEVVYLVEHLSANLGGSFVRVFAELLIDEGASARRPAALVLPALRTVIGSSPASDTNGGGDDG